MERFLMPAFVIGLWLFAWATDTGVLVFAHVDNFSGNRYRSCHYLIGLSVERDSEYAVKRPRCRLLVRIR
jgi:hypothetical protein